MDDEEFEHWLSEQGRKELEDVTQEYLDKATPGKGSFIADKQTLENDISTGEWLQNTFGGNIHILKDANKMNQKSVDAIWNNQLWEFKGISSRNSTDKQMQSGCNQLHEVHTKWRKEEIGGLVLDITSENMTGEAAEQYVRECIRRRAKDSMDIIIKMGDEIAVIMRYKK